MVQTNQMRNNMIVYRSPTSRARETRARCIFRTKEILKIRILFMILLSSLSTTIQNPFSIDAIQTHSNCLLNRTLFFLSFRKPFLYALCQYHSFSLRRWLFFVFESFDMIKTQTCMLLDE